ncbi:MAG TPA: AAA family ATPase, partial [Gaiellaceae bacterium]|nr:AAA family ATPase [Gaiellaceae bacterium]
MGEGTVIEAAAGQRYVIERPRLTKLLDESNARIILLLAPAGYGKTTLARQWLAQGGRRSVWTSATAASGDVAALAANLARALDTLVPGTERQMVRHLQAVSNPEREASSLSRTLIDALAQWPDDGWAVIDDYHFVCVSAAPDQFVENLISEAPVRLLVTSRRRPRWASARRVLYNEVAVIGPRELELTDSEARKVLA